MIGCIVGLNSTNDVNERCHKCGSLTIHHAADHLCRMHTVNGICEVCGNGEGYLRQHKTITITSSYYRVVGGAGVEGIQIDRDQFGNVISAKELVFWPFMRVNWNAP